MITLLIYYKRIKYKYYYKLIKNLRLLRNLKFIYLILRIELSLIKFSINFNLKKDLNIKYFILFYFLIFVIYKTLFNENNYNRSIINIRRFN